MSTSASFEPPGPLRDGQFDTEDPSLQRSGTVQFSLDDPNNSVESQNCHQVVSSSGGPPTLPHAAHFHAHPSTTGTYDPATGGSEAPGVAQAQQEAQVSSNTASISPIRASASASTTPIAASKSSTRTSAANSTGPFASSALAAPNAIPNSGPAILNAVQSQALAAPNALSVSSAENRGPPYVQSGVRNGPLDRCNAIYAEIQRLNAWRTLPSDQQPAAAVRQAREERVKELYAELFQAGKARLPSRKPDWACSTKELYEIYPAFGFWMRGAITDPSFLVPVNLDNWLFPRNTVTPEHIWGLAKWAGFTMSDGGAKAIWWKVIRECPRLAEESIGTWRERLWEWLEKFVAEAAAQHREEMELKEASKKRKRATEDLVGGRDQQPSKKGRGEVSDGAVSTARSSNLLSLSNDGPRAPPARTSKPSGTSNGGSRATSAKSSQASGLSNDGSRAISAKSAKPSGILNDGLQATATKSSKPSGILNDGLQATATKFSQPSGVSNDGSQAIATKSSKPPRKAKKSAESKLPREAPFHTPFVPPQNDDDKGVSGSGWSEREARVLYSLVKARRDYEKENNAGKADQLRDVNLWNEMSRKIRLQGFHRSSASCKCFWGRFGRDRFKYEERINPKNPGQLVTSAQLSKKEKEVIAAAKEEEE